MKTKIFDSKQIRIAAKLIVNGKLVAFPTETVYGLGANAFDAKAIKKIFVAKGRPSDNPLIVHVSNIDQIKDLAFINDKAKLLMDKFWPGPLTVVLRKKQTVPKEVTAGLDTVAIRMPSNKIAFELIKLSKVPIAAPSANRSGRPSSTSFEHVYEDLNGRIDGIIKSKDCDIGLESTVVDLTSKKPLLLRPGAITFEQLKKFFPNISIYHSKTKKPRSPGMKYRHYSPEAKVLLFERSAKDKIEQYKKEYELSGKKVEMINITDLDYASKKLFKKFRIFDKKKIDYILVSGCNEKGIGLALMNRLRKAATLIIK